MQLICTLRRKPMTANGIRASFILALNLIGLGSALSILFAGSHQYGAWSRVWQSFGIGGLFMIGFFAYLCSAAILVDVRRSRGSSYPIIFWFYVVSAVPMLLTSALVAAKLILGD